MILIYFWCVEVSSLHLDYAQMSWGLPPSTENFLNLPLIEKSPVNAHGLSWLVLVKFKDFCV